MLYISLYICIYIYIYTYIHTYVYTYTYTYILPCYLYVSTRASKKGVPPKERGGQPRRRGEGNHTIITTKLYYINRVIYVIKYSYIINVLY